MRAFQDKETGKWKWGTRGQAIYETKGQCERAAMDMLTARLRALRDKLNGVMINHGK
jgi:hypothetical protein